MPVLFAVLVGLACAQAHYRPDPWVAAVLVLQLVHALPAARRFRSGWTLAVQALLALPGGPWEFVAASVLLVVRGRLRWVLFAAVFAVAVVRNSGSVYAASAAASDVVAVGLAVHALTRLTELRAELRATRAEVAARSVAAERDRAARRLDAELGDALAAIVRLAADGAAGRILVLAREAADRARSVPRRPPEGSPGPEAAAGPGPTALGPRLLYPTIVAAHLLLIAVAVPYLLGRGLPGPVLGVYIAVTVVLAVLQIYHWVLLPSAARDRPVVWTLAVQNAVSVWLLFAPYGPFPQFVPLAMATLLALRGGRRAARAAAAAGTALVPAALLLRGAGWVAAAQTAVHTVTVLLLFYGLALLVALVGRTQQARLALAELTAAQERRRISRDVHDLLGYGISAIAVKAQLAEAVPERAAGELAEIGRLARRTLGDLRAVSGAGPGRLDPRREAVSARTVLGSAGMQVDLDVDGSALDALPDPVRSVLAAAVREAAANVLRHGGGRRCAIALHAPDGAGTAALTVVNDAPPAGSSSPGTPGGSGLPNLRARLAEVGGSVHAGPEDDGSWRLRLSVPVGCRP